MSNKRSDFRVNIPRHLFASAESKAQDKGWTVSQYVAALIATDTLQPDDQPINVPDKQPAPTQAVNLWG